MTELNRYLATVRETVEYTIEIEARNADEAKDLIREGEGTALEGGELVSPIRIVRIRREW